MMDKMNKRSRSFSEIGPSQLSPSIGKHTTSTGSRSGGRKRSRSLDDCSDAVVVATQSITNRTDGQQHHHVDHVESNEYYDITWKRIPHDSNHHSAIVDVPSNDSNNDQRSTHSNTNTAVIIVKRDDTRICMKGRGYITNCSSIISESDEHYIISVHGFHLYPQPETTSTLSSNNNTTVRDDIRSTVYFDSALWSSWITISLHRGHKVRISSCSMNPHSNNQEYHPHQPLTSKCTFDIYNVMNPTSMIRPTIIPTTWCNAVQSIVQDYATTKTGRTETTTMNINGPEKDDTTTSATTTTTKNQPTVMYQHLSYFQESMDDDEDDDNINSDIIHDENDSNHENNIPSSDSTDHNTIYESSGYQIMICGAKGVGKSTCLRYCINQLLNVTSYVMVLDADVGQPEYTTPGMLQLTLVHDSTPNLVPPHISQLIPINSNNNNTNINFGKMNNTSGTTIAASDPSSTLNTNPMSVIARHYFGSITSAIDLISYMQCIESLLNRYKDNCHISNTNNENEEANDNDCGTANVNPTTKNKSCNVIPLLVNLDGWTKDVGYEILTTLIQDTFQLRHVIQISGNTISKILDLSGTIHHHNNSNAKNNIRLYKCDAYNIRPTTNIAATPTINGRAIGDSEIDDDNDDEEEEEDVVVVVVDQVTAKKTTRNEDNDKSYVPTTSIIPASILRDIRLITYFMPVDEYGAENNGDNNHHISIKIQHASQIWDMIHVSSQGIDDTTHYTIGNTFAAARPYVISMDTIHIRFTLSEIHNDITSDDHIMDAINGTLVGLCTLPTNEDDDQETATVLLPCLGLGLVRAIDRKRHLLFLITPIGIECLQDVNCLTIGSNIHLPVQCYYRGPIAEAFPYLKFTFQDSVHILGSDPMKSRNNINRRGRASGGGGG